jgi:hypothetical protein
MVSSLFCLLASLLVLIQVQEPQPKLMFIQTIFRHGARYPEQILHIGDEFVQDQQLLG